MFDPQRNVMPDLQFEIDRLKAANEALKHKLIKLSEDKCCVCDYPLNKEQNE